MNCSKLSLRVHIKCNFPNSWCTSNMVNKWKSRSVHSKVNFSFKAKQLGRDPLKLLLNLHLQCKCQIASFFQFCYLKNQVQGSLVYLFPLVISVQGTYTQVRSTRK